MQQAAAGAPVHFKLSTRAEQLIDHKGRKGSCPPLAMGGPIADEVVPDHDDITPGRRWRGWDDRAASVAARKLLVVDTKLSSPNTPDDDPTSMAILCAELHSAYRLEQQRAAALERRLHEMEMRLQDSERIAEHALMLANGVLSAVHASQSGRPCDEPGDKPPVPAPASTAPAAPEEPVYEPFDQPRAPAGGRRQVVGGVSVIRCDTCGFTCGTKAALGKHIATAHGLKPTPQRTRGPPPARSSGMGVADLSRPPLLASHTAHEPKRAEPEPTADHDDGDRGPDAGWYEEPSVVWLRACGINNAARNRLRRDSEGSEHGSVDAGYR